MGEAVLKKPIFALPDVETQCSMWARKRGESKDRSAFPEAVRAKNYGAVSQAGISEDYEQPIENFDDNLVFTCYIRVNRALMRACPSHGGAWKAAEEFLYMLHSKGIRPHRLIGAIWDQRRAQLPEPAEEVIERIYRELSKL